MKVRAEGAFTVLYRDGEPVAAWDMEKCECEFEESLTEDALKDIITECLSLLHKFLHAETMILPNNPANIPYMSQ